MMHASYYDEAEEKATEIQACSVDDLQSLLGAVLAQRSQRGHPTLELTRPDGASLSLSTDGKRAYLVWIDSLGESFHSVGNQPHEDSDLIFDYFGSWSEASAEHLVGINDAIDSVRAFFLNGTADTDRVLFQPD